MLDHNPLEAVYIYIDTATYDEIEKDRKVTLRAHIILMFELLGDIGGPIGFDWRHNGPSYWLLHPQRGRDCLLPPEVSWFS